MAQSCKGLTHEERRAARESRIRRTAQMFDTGYSDKAIAKALGVSLTAISDYRAASGRYRKGPYKARVPAPKRDCTKPIQTAASAIRAASTTLEAKQRTCLRCGTEFFSEWAGNRLCKPCQHSHDWRSGGDFTFQVSA